MISKSDLGPELTAIGLLTGLLKDAGASVEVRADWFDDPLATSDPGEPTLGNMGQRLDQLVALLRATLSATKLHPAAVFPGSQWYVVPDPRNGDPSPFHIVAPDSAAPSGQIGLGALVPVQVDNLSTTVYVYLPLFAYEQNGSRLVVTDGAYPAQIGFRASTVDGKGFHSSGVSFSALTVDVALPLDPAAYEATPAPQLLNVVFENLAGTSKPPKYHALDALLDADVQAWLGEVILQASSWLEIEIGESFVTIGTILAGAGVIAVSNGDNYHLNIASLSDLDPFEIVMRFVFGTMKAFADADPPFAVVPLPFGGIYFVWRGNADGTIDYGLRLATQIQITGSDTPVDPPDGGSPTAKPPLSIHLSVGTYLTGDDDNNNWIGRSRTLPGVEPGISVFLVNVDRAMNVVFKPGVTLASVGFDVLGGAGTPLFDVSGYTVKGAELRAYLDSESDWTFGFACRLDDLGFPLGPNFGSAVQGSGTNPVAQNLVQSGSNAGGDQKPVNPTMSVAAGFVEGGSFALQLYDANETPTNQVTIPIQRSLGPLHCQDLGIGWTHDQDVYRLSLLFDGGITLAGLSVDLRGLTIGVPLNAPSDFSKYVLDLHGLGIALSAGEVELSAALVKVPPNPNAKPPRTYTEYDGEAMLKAGTFAVEAFGSYAHVSTSGGGFTSLFIFGILDADIGGPAFFYVTGLAAGFGYNRRLVLPEKDGVADFPFVAAASDPTTLGATKQSDGTFQAPDPTVALAKLDAFVPPERGQYWLAAGVRFTSFDLINSTALLVVEFGNELEIALLGLSWMSLPPPPLPGASAPVERYAYGELGIEVTVLPSEGIFSATAILTPNSFVIDPACRLTGGFAFTVWFGRNPHAGEFVLTLGGYHPAFTPPAYYPTVPRLGFSWPVSTELAISGDAYFALTPSAVMAGAGLQVLFSRGELKAWLNARMDAIVVWAPFHYTLHIGVNVGVSYRVDALFIHKTFSFEASANLDVWGPKMGGRAHMTFQVVSVTIAFGAAPTDTPAPLSWSDANGAGFAQTLLPQNNAPATKPVKQARARAARLAASAAPNPSGGIYTMTVNGGLITSFDDSGSTIWVVRPNDFVFSIASAIPLTEIDLQSSHVAAPDASGLGTSYYVCVRPMRATLSSSVLSIGLHDDDGNEPRDFATAFAFDVTLARVPAAKWGRPLPAGQEPEPNALLDSRVVGLQNITPKTPSLTPAGDAALDIDVLDAFSYDVVDADAPWNPNHLPLRTDAVPPGLVPDASDQAFDRIENALMRADVVALRDEIFAELHLYGIDAAANGPLTRLAADPGAYLTGNPLVVAAS